MTTRKCALCQDEFTPVGQGNFRYCPTCREKIARREVDKPHAYWLTDAERTRKRATYFRKMQARKERYAHIEARRTQGEMICYWCRGPIPVHRLKHNPQQKFCKRACFAQDRREYAMLTEFYYHIGKKGNQRLREMEYEQGIRPGTEKRQLHACRLNEARRNGKPWGKTGPKKCNKKPPL